MIAPMTVATILHHLELIPLTWLVLLHRDGQKRGAAWWWLAAAFTVSWVADAIARELPPDERWVVSLVYVVSQAALIGAVFLDRLDALRFTLVLGMVGVADVLLFGRAVLAGPDILLRTVAWGSVAGLAWQTPARVRASLLVTFGLGLVCWLAYTAVPGWTTYLTYKAAWTTGLVVFCAAASSPAPRLIVARRNP